MVAWIQMSDARKRTVLAQVSDQKNGVSEQVIEKDAWVTLVLEALFKIPAVGEHLVFKGGTSLSKGYNLIGRFSEDIDFAIDRKLLGFPDTNLSNRQIRDLRRASATFIKEQLAPLLSDQLMALGLSGKEFNVRYLETEQSDLDPLPLYVEYKPVSGTSAYLADKVILEIGARSLMEPSEPKEIRSMIAEVYPGQPFAGTAFDVPIVLPTRTFLEKLFLLHELFLSPVQNLPRNRMSRHLYDLEKLMSTEYAASALNDRHLFEHIVEHRRTLTPVKGISYDRHTLTGLNILPPVEMMGHWEADYGQFIDHMVIGEKLSFPALVERLKGLQESIRTTVWR